MTGKQFNALVKLLDKQHQVTSGAMSSICKSMLKSFKKMHKQLDKIYDKLKSSKVSWLTVLAGVCLLLLPFMWDRIKSFFSSISQKFDLADKINKGIKLLSESIDWDGHISSIVEHIKKAVKAVFASSIENPFSRITEKFTGAYDAMIEWTKDIWAYVKGKLSWTKEKQDENEQKAENAVADKTTAAVNSLEKCTTANVQQAEANVNDAC